MRQIVLYKHGHTHIFRYQRWQKTALFNALLTNKYLDFFDVAVICIKLGPKYMDKLKVRVAKL
jgi:hypothetical protein